MGRGKGMDSALWVVQEDCRNAEASLPPRHARTFSLLRLLWFIVFVVETRGIMGGRTYSVRAPCAEADFFRQVS